mmetsp:Transcript_58571/g.117636  ORF Transcript_58571/g.117636 Transcript_58571/m.117636 type:complete len:389 (-) Transcript_58571:247-1413(-)
MGLSSANLGALFLFFLFQLKFSYGQQHASYISELKRVLNLTESSTLVSISRPEKGERAYDLEARPSPVVVSLPTAMRDDALTPIYFVFDLSEFEAAANIALDYTNLIGRARTARQDCEGCGLIDEMCTTASNAVSPDNCSAWLRTALLDEMIWRSSYKVCGVLPARVDEGTGDQATACHRRMNSALRTQLASMVMIRDAARQQAGSVAASVASVDSTATHVLLKIPLPSFADFELFQYAKLCDELSSLATINHEALEGNIWVDGAEVEREALMQAFATVDAATELAGSPSWTLLEVGFNAGHSSAMALSSFPRVRVRSFDICHHGYTKPNYEFLVHRFADSGTGQGPRLQLWCGDSRETLKAATVNEGKAGGNFQAADVVRVDGWPHP